MNSKRNAIIIGGTGIIGMPVVFQLIASNEYNVHSISLERASNPAFPTSVQQHIIDRNTPKFEELIEEITSKINYDWDVVIDLISFDEKSAQQTYKLFKNCSQQIITLSTTLVYNRSSKTDVPISEETPLAQKGELGGYVDGKLRLEEFWQKIPDSNWTILRPYHILGAHSLLGCIPEENRDPKILDRIKSGETLNLCSGGEIKFNFIHPKDIATAIHKVIGNKQAFRQVFNLVNPQVIVAKDYYSEIARQLGVDLSIKNVPVAQIWKEMKGWEMTTLPHLYSMKKMGECIGYMPETPLVDAIKDSIMYYPATVVPIESIPVHQRMNKLPRPKKIEWLLN